MAVKININASAKAESEPEYIYHWDRIGFAVAVILAICSGLWFGFSKWSEKHGSASLAKPETTTMALAEPEPRIQVPVKTQDIQPKVKAEVAKAVSQPVTPAVKATPPPAKAETKQPEPVVTKPETTVKTTAAPELAQTEPQQDNNSHQLLDFIQKRTQILDESVTRYVVASGVENKEPVGSLKTLTHRKGGVARVYVFSDVQNFKGETIQYHWYQNDNLLAKVDIEVKGNRWRNKTFQNIGPAMTGRWRVELMFGNITLAKTEFVVKRINK